MVPANEKWMIRVKNGIWDGYLRNPSDNKSLPSNGWEYYGYEAKKWNADPTLVISPGPLTLCDSLTVSASGPAAREQSLSLGEFSRTEMWWNGKPVFRNRYGQLLRQSGKGWDVGPNLGKAGLRGSMAYHCPGSEEKWTYWDVSQWKPASVTIDCKVHA